MTSFTSETLERVLAATDLVALIGAVTPLQRTGTKWRGHCPFEPDPYPAFVVHPARHIFHCFHCSAGGDAFAFLMRHAGLSFPEAVRQVALTAGYTLLETPRLDVDDTHPTEEA